MEARARARGGTSSWFGLPPWIALFVVAGVIVGAGFLLWFAAQSFTRSSTLDAQRVRSLNLAADYIAKWPDVARSIAQTSLYHRTKSDKKKEPNSENTYYANLYHPEFGEFQVEYDLGQSNCHNGVQIYKNSLTVTGEALASSAKLSAREKTYNDTARDASWIPLKGKKGPVCFKIANLDLAKVAPPLGSFSHLLLIDDTASAQQKSNKNKKTVKESGGEKSTTSEQPTGLRTGRVVAWVGPSELPIRRLSDLPALQSEVSKAVVAAAQATLTATTNQIAAIQPPNSGPSDALQPFNSRVAGKSYRFYWRPIALDLPADGDSGPQQLSYYLVGVAPAGAAASEPGESRTEILGFAVVLFMLIALIPVVKLVLLGPVDTMKEIEVAAICVGIVAATAFGTALWIGVRDVLIARSAESSEIAGTARALVRNVERDLRDALFSSQMVELSQNFGRLKSAPLVFGFAPEADSATAVKVENLVLFDGNGRQAAGTVINAARNYVGANFDLSDRTYFRRALDEDFAPNGEHLLAELRKGHDACYIWNDTESGLVFDGVRSRTDGTLKAIMAARLRKPATSLKCGQNPVKASDIEQLQPSVVAAAFVMWRMESPRLDSGVRYAVLDLRNERDAIDHPVLFHSDPGRAGVERFDEPLDARTRAKLADEIGDPVPCTLNQSTGVPRSSPAREFTGIHEEHVTQFAVARVPCTDWAVVAFKSRRLIDSEALRPAVYATLVWASLMIVPLLLWILAAFWWGRRVWIWMWPDPVKKKKDAYRYLAIMLAVVVPVAMVLVAFARPFMGSLLSVIGAGAALGWLAWMHDGAKSAPGSDRALDKATELRFAFFAVALLVTISVMPVLALAADARGYYEELSAAHNDVARQKTDDERLRSWHAIARMEGIETPPIPNHATKLPECANCPDYFVKHLRAEAGHEDTLEQVSRQPFHWFLGLHGFRYVDDFTLLPLLMLIVMILWLAIRASLQGLFGFGVALEAIEYPTLKVGHGGGVEVDDLPPRFLVVGADERLLQALKRRAEEMDLNSDIRKRRALRLPSRGADGPKLLLIRNLGQLLGDPDYRREALERLERIVAEQGEPPRYRIAILTSLTPLERLLQSFERERDENDRLGEEAQTTARLERAKHREDMRWSAVFEEFTTYYQAAVRRVCPENLDLDKEGHAVKLIWQELEYVPDQVVAAMIGHAEKPLSCEHILNWARGIADHHPGDSAIVDYLASSLIEHYHLMWALSSREERLLLYRIAHGHTPNIARAYALRSLVKRGLVVLDPYPRTMNQSFAQFVQHVETPKTITRWRRSQVQGSWGSARLLLALALPLALGVLIFAAIRNGDSLAAIIPLIIATGPALIHALGAAKRTAAA